MDLYPKPNRFIHTEPGLCSRHSVPETRQRKCHRCVTNTILDAAITSEARRGDMGIAIGLLRLKGV